MRCMHMPWCMHMHMHMACMCILGRVLCMLGRVYVCVDMHKDRGGVTHGSQVQPVFVQPAGQLPQHQVWQHQLFGQHVPQQVLACVFPIVRQSRPISVDPLRQGYPQYSMSCP